MDKYDLVGEESACPFWWFIGIFKPIGKNIKKRINHVMKKTTINEGMLIEPY